MNNFSLLSASLSVPLVIGIAFAVLLVVAICCYVVYKIIKNKRSPSVVVVEEEPQSAVDFSAEKDENISTEQLIDNNSIDLNNDASLKEETIADSTEEVADSTYLKEAEEAVDEIENVVEEVENVVEKIDEIVDFSCDNADSSVETVAESSEAEEDRVAYPVEEEDVDETPVIDDEEIEEKEEPKKIMHPDEAFSEGDIEEENPISEPLGNAQNSYSEEFPVISTTEEKDENLSEDGAYDDVIAKSVELGASLLEDEENEGTGKIIFGGKEIRVRYLRSFTAKLCQSNDLVKERYGILKNELLSYKKAKARTSWHCETFRLGRPAFAKLSVRGKTLTLYLALSPEDFVGTKYHFKDVSSVKKYSAVPMCLKIKSNRAVRWAKELISKLAEDKGFKRLDLEEVDYYPEYRTTKELVLDKLIKLTGVDAEKEYFKIQNDVEGVEATFIETAVESEIAVSENQEILQIDNRCIDLPSNHQNHAPYAVILEVDLSSETPAKEAVEDTAYEAVEPITNDKVVLGEENLVERDFEIQETVSVYGADKAMSDEEAESLIETAKAPAVAKKEVVGKAKAIINVDVLSKNFNSGDVVTLSVLKDKKLLQKNVGYFKVLGRGVINKALVVEANEFSVNAAKMILLTGGRAIIVS